MQPPCAPAFLQFIVDSDVLVVALQDIAHAAASVHATVMSEEDAFSEGETNPSSRRRSVPQPAAALARDAENVQKAQHDQAGTLFEAHPLCSTRPFVPTVASALLEVATGRSI